MIDEVTIERSVDVEICVDPIEIYESLDGFEQIDFAKHILKDLFWNDKLMAIMGALTNDEKRKLYKELTNEFQEV